MIVLVNTLAGLSSKRSACADEPSTSRRTGSDSQQANETSNGDEFLSQYAATYRFSLGRPTSIRLTKRGEAVLFLRSGPRSFVRNLYEFNSQTGTERVLITADQILGGGTEQLTDEERARRERQRLAARGIAYFDLSDDGRRILIPLSGQLYIVDRASAAVTALKAEGAYPIDPRLSPDGSKVACVRDGDLYVIDVESGAQRQLTSGATATLTHGLAEFVAQEEMGRMHGYWWSPDGKLLAYQQTDTSQVEELCLADPAHPERPPVMSRYPRPGKANATVRLGIISVKGGETTWVTWNADRYPYLATVAWDEVGAPLSILVQDRAQQQEFLLAVDPSTGQTTQLHAESDPAWINLDQQMPHWLNDGKGFLWTTERTGAWTLELRNPDGSLQHELTSPELGYRGLAGLDEQAGLAFVMASANPTEVHLYRVPLDPAKGRPERLTDAAGIYAAEYSQEAGVSVRSVATLSDATRYTVHGPDGRKLGELKYLAEQPALTARVELTVAGSDPAFHAAVIRPSTFDPNRRYPVIVQVYGGPHSQMVTAARDRYLLGQWIAERGYIVVSIDGRGTPGRGRDWERAIRGNLIAIPLKDQVHGLEALAKLIPQMDLGRVGIFGWSFGGYFSAQAVMQRPDVFRAAVAGAPVADWLDYDTHYTERYLGLPAEYPDAYRVSSVLTYADKLDRPLLLMHGTTDDNVFFLHSLKISDTLFRAGRRHEFLPLVDFTHMVTDPTVNERLYGRIIDFFTRELVSGRPVSR